MPPCVFVAAGVAFFVVVTCVVFFFFVAEGEGVAAAGVVETGVATGVAV